MAIECKIENDTNVLATAIVTTESLTNLCCCARRHAQQTPSIGMVGVFDASVMTAMMINQ